MTGQDSGSEIARVEIFSDGVMAIIITIMVLDLKVPAQDGMAGLRSLWPTFLAYALSYAYVGVYWVNHHRLFSHATVVTNALLWSNMSLLFTLSLVPFATAYLHEHRFGLDATLLYLTTLLLPACCYVILQTVIRRSGENDAATRRYHVATMRKGTASTLIYALGLALSFVSPALGIGCAALVAVLWCQPSSWLDRLFLYDRKPGGDVAD